MIVYDHHRGRGHICSLAAAQNYLGDDLAAVLTTHVARYEVAAVHFWDALERQHFVANWMMTDLEGASITSFEKRSLPLTHFMPKARCGDGHKPDLQREMKTWILRFNADPILPQGEVIVKARTEALARAIARDRFDDISDQVSESAQMNLEQQLNEWGPPGPHDLEDVEEMD